ncbi:MAG: hypothetical protein GWP10_18715 [Nitrospiraceae bacterium]|nr:hypothetical protein [Nitrospiraceae bacterium]
MTNSIQKREEPENFRLALLDGVTGRPIADELYDRKDPLTVETFLEAHLDPTKQIFVVTDLYSSYPGVFGENLIHQLCLLHLNKMMVLLVDCWGNVVNLVWILWSWTSSTCRRGELGGGKYEYRRLRIGRLPALHLRTVRETFISHRSSIS